MQCLSLIHMKYIYGLWLTTRIYRKLRTDISFKENSFTFKSYSKKSLLLIEIAVIYKLLLLFVYHLDNAYVYCCFQKFGIENLLIIICINLKSYNFINTFLIIIIKLVYLSKSLKVIFNFK